MSNFLVDSNPENQKEKAAEDYIRDQSKSKLHNAFRLTKLINDYEKIL